MRGFKETILVLALGLSGAVQAQYIGSNRPPDRQEVLDSLAARLDTARFAADSLRLDSLATAGAGKDSILDARIDSVRDNPGGGSSGGNVALDTIFYDYILGFTAADSSRAGGYSKFIKLGGTQADTSDSDTLIWCIDQLKATGGDIYICGTPADTIWWYQGGTAYDSLPTSGGIDANVTIDGDGMDKVIHRADGSTLTNNFVWTTDRHAGVGGALLIWKHQQFYGVTSWSGGHAYRAVQVNNGSEKFYHCRIVQSWPGGSGQYDASATCKSDSTIVIDHCVFGSADGSIYGGGTWNGTPYLEIRNCRGYFNMADSREEHLLMQGCNFNRVKEMTTRGSGVYEWDIIGNTLHFENHATYEGMFNSGSANGVLRVIGNTIYGPSDGSVPLAVQQGGWGPYSFTQGNYFYYCGVDTRGTVSGNTFYSAATGAKAYNTTLFLRDNTFNSCTTGIDPNSQSETLVQANTFVGCTTDVASAPSDSTGNYSY